MEIYYFNLLKEFIKKENNKQHKKQTNKNSLQLFCIKKKGDKGKTICQKWIYWGRPLLTTFYYKL